MIPAGLLAGVCVVSIEQYISAPYCTQILAEAGADVIKIERPDGGDPRRAYDPMMRLGDEEISGGFASYNRGKSSAVLDLTSTEDHADIVEMLADADVFVSNLRPGALGRAGLSVEEIRTRYPSLIVCEISGFGATGGPFADLTAFDSVIQAMSGMSSLIGSRPDAPPMLAPMSTMDLLTGIWAALGISAALVRRGRTGQGCHIDAAMYDVGASLMERSLTLHEFTGETPIRGIDRYSPVGVFRAFDDRWLSIVIPTDEMWRRCCQAIGRPELIADPDLDSVVKRASRMEGRIVPVLEEWAKRLELDARAAAAALRAAGQPVGIVQTIDEVRGCPHLAHRGLFTPLQFREGGAVHDSGVALPRMPLLIDGAASRPGPVPGLGDYAERGGSDPAG